jgi:hypothetical protein
MIANFPPAERQRGTINPEGGAYVEIWNDRSGRMDPGAFESEGGQTDGSFDLSVCCHGRLPIRIKEVKSRDVSGITVMDYFDLGSGHKLIAALYFWPDDPKQSEYLKLLHWMIGTIHLNPPGRR